MSKTLKKTLKSFVSNKDTKKLKESLRQLWLDLYPEEKDQAYEFLYLTDQTKLFWYFLCIDLQSNTPDIPWLQFIALLERRKSSLAPAIFDELNMIMQKQDALKEIKEDLPSLLESLKTKRRNSWLQTIAKKKQELLASARIADSEGLDEQHMLYMQELKKIAPSEYNVSRLISSQERERAERAIQKHIRQGQTPLVGRKTTEDKDELQLLAQISKQAETYWSQGKAKATDFAYLLRSIGESRKGVEFIEAKPNDSQKDWQLLDYLFHGGQYLTLLEHSRKLKKKYTNKPDALFSVYYYEAIAYWELGERDRAIELMKQISTMRPDFKSSVLLLAQWKEERLEKN